MSIYSGFATRQQQQIYDSYVQNLIEIFQKRLLKFYNKEQADQSKFVSIIKKLFFNMKKMEKYKYLQPKLSQSFQQIYSYLQVKNQQFVKQQQFQIQRPDLHQINSSYPVRISLNKQKNIIDSYEVESQKRSESFRISRPLTTKFTSYNKIISDKQKESDIKNEVKTPDIQQETIKNVLEQYLNGPGKAKLSKTQKNYMKAYKRHKNEINILFNSQNPRSQKSVKR